MCKICGLISCSSYKQQMIESLAREKERIENSKKETDSILFHNPLGNVKLENIPLFEARVGQPTPLKYYQDMYVDGERWPIVWRHDSFRAISIADDGSLILVSKHPDPYERAYTHYLELRIEKGKYKYELDETGYIRISFSGSLMLTGIRTGKTSAHQVSFNFESKPFHFVSQRESVTALTKEAHRMGSRQGKLEMAQSKFENYVVTVPQFSLHPYLLNDFEKCGYKRRTDLQSEGPAFFREHLEL